MAENAELLGPDLEKDGVAAHELAEGEPFEGHAAGEPVLLCRKGGEVLAIGARCTHYGARLVDGIVTGDVVRCPWHHARFDLRTGRAEAPALEPLPCFATVEREGRIHVTGKRAESPPERRHESPVRRLVVLGAGAAGASAVETLRREGFEGEIALVDRDDAGPVDRPNLSKDYLAGKAPEEWLPLRPKSFYEERGVELHLGSAAVALDTRKKQLTLQNGTTLDYDALLYAPGAEPVRLPLPGADLPHVLSLRTLGDSRAIIALAESARRAVVIGASFIGLEVAASLRARSIEVDVVAPEPRPLAKVLGDEVGAFVQELHESHGVRFHLGRKPRSIASDAVTLDDGQALPCELVVMGVGVRPVVELARAAGIDVDGGVLTDAQLRTSAEGVFAAGDVASYAAGDHERRRVEHWVHAERQGAAAARNMLGRARPFREVPFFWSVHYDVTLSYVGWAESWDTVQIAGSLAERDATIAYRKAGAIRAIATIGRDRASLCAEEAMERGDSAALEALLGRA